MHVLVATDGSLDPEKAADFAARLAGPDGSTTVATIVRVPRMLLSDLRKDYGEMSGVAVGSDSEYVGSPSVDTGTPRGWPGDDAMIDQYLGDKRIDRCRPVVTTIRDAGGTAESVVREGEDSANDIIALAKEIGADTIVIGSHGGHAFQGLLGSTGSKIVRRAECAVLVIR
jgi:nucleotide-binding universal stress UspA family protein